MTATSASVPAVLVAGDALVDLTPTTTVRGTAAYEPHAGGSCLNVAVGLARLEVPAALLARVSTDGFGRLLRDHLAASGVLPAYLVDTDDVTTLATVHLRDGQATYSFHVERAADRGLLPEHLGDLPDGAALHVGSIALVLEPVASTLDALLRREAGRRVVSLDPNVRPGLIADRAAYLERFAGWVRSVDLLKVSEEDLAWLHPGLPQDEVVAGWLQAGVSLVLVTRGADGALARTASASVTLAAPQVPVVDTVGAGDAFTAGALAHLHGQGLLTRDALPAMDAAALTALLQQASLVAADTCTRAGADPPRRGALRGRGPHAPSAVRATRSELVERARALAVPGRRRLLGITGAPGAGKSVTAQALVDALGPELAVLVPMDGFHLSNATLVRWDRRDRKGAWDTFDADGYVGLLRRLRRQTDDVVHAPDFDRDVDESIGSAIPVGRAVPLVVTEGNYLLSSTGAFASVAELLDESWYLELDEPTRLERLVARHQRHGKDREAATAWACGPDQANAELVAASRRRADRVVTVVEGTPR